MSEPTIEDYYVEDRTFSPSQDFTAAALLSDNSHQEEAAVDYEAFWARQARELLTWDEDFHTTLEWDLPFARWFVGGKLNLSANCLDRHVDAGYGDRIAYYWEGEPGDTREITYSDLLAEVSAFANVMKGLGLEKGDRVAIYMPMILELPIAMLACTRIGVAHSVIFGGFSPDSIVDRCEDAEARLVITADAGYRRGAPSALKVNVDAALDIGAPSVEHVVVVNRCDTEVTMADGRDLWWHDLMADASPDCPAEPMDSEQLLYLLYTSGTTAKPKGIMHTTGGYLTQVAYTHRYVFDVRRNEDVYWCAADIGWVTGHSYIVYGPLTNGCTSVMYEGTPDTPRPEHRTGDRADWPRDRLWDIIERYGVTQLYTAPTAIRTFMKWGAEDPARHDLSSLRVLGTVGEPINPRGLDVVPRTHRRKFVPDRRHLVADRDRWPHDLADARRHHHQARLGLPHNPRRVRRTRRRCGQPGRAGGGYLTITRPWPAMLRGIWGDPERYHDTYWSRFEGRYFAGDGAKVDDDGYLWLLGRVDDVMNVSGHRISTAEVESALVDHPAVAEAAVVGATDATTGQAIIGYVILRGGNEATPELGEEVRGHVATKLGPIARPKAVFLVPDLPKTRSGKIMRRLLRDVAEGRDLGDTTTLADAGVVAEIRERAAESPEED